LPRPILNLQRGDQLTICLQLSYLRTRTIRARSTLILLSSLHNLPSTVTILCITLILAREASCSVRILNQTTHPLHHHQQATPHHTPFRSNHSKVLRATALTNPTAVTPTTCRTVILRWDRLQDITQDKNSSTKALAQILHADK